MPLQSHKLLQDIFHIAVNDHILSANSSAHCFKHVGQLGAFDRCLRLPNFSIHQGKASSNQQIARYHGSEYVKILNVLNGKDRQAHDPSLLP